MDWSDIGVALGLVLVIEGLLLALIPERLVRLVVALLHEPPQRLRWAGAAGAALGILIVWLIRA